MGALTSLVPLPYRIAMVVLLLLASVGAGFVKGIDFENDRHAAKEQALQKAVDEQTAKVAVVTTEQERITKEVPDKYESRIASIDNYYSGLRNDGNGSSVQQVPGTPEATDASTTYRLLAKQCAKTTEQLEELQSWITQEAGVTNLNKK